MCETLFKLCVDKSMPLFYYLYKNFTFKSTPKCNQLSNTCKSTLSFKNMQDNSGTKQNCIPF